MMRPNDRPPACAQEDIRRRGRERERKAMRTQGGIGDDISVGRRSKPVGCVTPKGTEGRGMLPPPPPQMMHQKEVRGVTIAFYDGVESS